MQIYKEEGRWKELLAKDGSLLTDAEYMALADIYWTLDNSEIEEFFKLCYGEGTLSDINKITRYTDGTVTKLFYSFEPDEVKIQKLVDSMAALVSNNYVELIEAVKQGDDSKKYKIEDDRLVMLQKIGLLKALAQVGKITNKWGVITRTL